MICNGYTAIAKIPNNMIDNNIYGICNEWLTMHIKCSSLYSYRLTANKIAMLLY